MIERTSFETATVVFEPSYTSAPLSIQGNKSILVVTTTNLVGETTVTWNGLSFTKIATTPSIKMSLWYLHKPPHGTAPVEIVYPGNNVGYIIIEEGTGFHGPPDSAVETEDDPVEVSISLGKKPHIFVALIRPDPPSSDPLPATLTEVATILDGSNRLSTYADTSPQPSYTWSYEAVGSTQSAITAVFLNTGGVGTSYGIGRFLDGSPHNAVPPEQAARIAAGKQAFMGPR